MKMTRIFIDEAKSGMVTTKDIFIKDTQFLILNTGSVLNKRKIDRLKEFGIYTIDVLSESEKDSVRILKEPFKPIYDELKKKTHRYFEKLRLQNKVEAGEIIENANEIIDIIAENNNLLSLLKQMESDDEYLYKHSVAVGIITAMLAKWMNFEPKLQIEASIAGTFHDIGKIRTPQHILNKPSKLTLEEFDIIKEHSRHGYDILNTQSWATKNVKIAVYQHHERNDGSGYPEGLKAPDISVLAKLVAIGDVFDAVTTKRAYKDKLSPFDASEIIFKESIHRLDTEFCQVLLKKLTAFYVGNVVSLNNGKVGEIVFLNPMEATRPLIRVENQFIDLASERELKIIDILE